MPNKDYYKILGVEREATEEEIKKAYRKLAHEHHPDKKGGDEKKFKEINEAYQILSNKQKRESYDRFGTAEPMGGFGGHSWAGFENGFPGWGDGFGFSVDGRNFSDFDDFNDVLQSFFEGIGVRPKRRTYERGSDLQMTEEVFLEEAFSGVTKKVNIRANITCSECGGRGAKDKSDFINCSVCGGQGEIREQRRTFFGSFSQVKACENCRGSGKVPKNACKACKGSGRVQSEREIKLDILPGVGNGQIIKVTGGGEAGERGNTAGDLYVRIKIKPHGVFERKGADLIVKKEIKVLDLLLGRKLEIPTIGGGKLNVEVPAGFNLKENMRIPNEGMPHFGSYGRGDLLVDFIVKAPKKLGDKERKILEDSENN
ncbi:MAG: molecular chaperone DnaJ [Patescibacteria group bacterium]